jgi:hypothetical protein
MKKSYSELKKTHLHLLLNKQEKRVLDELARRSGLTKSSLLRNLFMEKAENKGINISIY